MWSLFVVALLFLPSVLVIHVPEVRQIIKECGEDVPIRCHKRENIQDLHGSVNYYNPVYTCSTDHTLEEKQCYLSYETLSNMTACGADECYLKIDGIYNDSCFTDTGKIWYKVVEARDHRGEFQGSAEANLVDLTLSGLTKAMFDKRIKNLSFVVVNDTCRYCDDDAYCSPKLKVHKKVKNTCSGLTSECKVQRFLDLTQRCLMRSSFIQLFYTCLQDIEKEGYSYTLKTAEKTTAGNEDSFQINNTLTEDRISVQVLVIGGFTGVGIVLVAIVTTVAWILKKKQKWEKEEKTEKEARYYSVQRPKSEVEMHYHNHGHNLYSDLTDDQYETV